MLIKCMDCSFCYPRVSDKDPIEVFEKSDDVCRCGRDKYVGVGFVTGLPFREGPLCKNERWENEGNCGSSARYFKPLGR
jgi:hypothetical protein